MKRALDTLPYVGLAIALVVLVATTGSGPGWNDAAGHASLAAQLERLSAAPLYGALAGVAAQLPFGEVGFRTGVLAAVLGALTLAGVVACTRALLPKDPVAGLLGAALLLVAAPLRQAAAAASPSILTACGIVWMLAATLSHAREPHGRRAAFALAMLAVVVGSAPWLGLALGVVVVASLARDGADRRLLALGIAALGVTVVVLWLDAIGSVSPRGAGLSAMVGALGGGATAVLVGAGLIGTAFGAATGLPRARRFALVALVVAVHALVLDPAGAPVCAVLAVGAAVIPSAIVRVLPDVRRELVVLAASVPLFGVALLAGPTWRVDDPGDAPATLARDLIGDLPPGPGVVVMRSPTAWTAVHHAQVVAGARPDLRLVPPAPPQIADAIVADALRGKMIAGADVPAFGRLDPALALPRSRGFELRLRVATSLVVPPLPPARYATTVGVEQATLLAVSRARYEVLAGRLDAAARAAGLTDRFRAADLAVLATVIPSRERPPLYDFLPRLGDPPPGRWMLDLVGDDLAWVAGLDVPAPDAGVPASTRLHALWRDILVGKRAHDDPELLAFGPAAIIATELMLATVRAR